MDILNYLQVTDSIATLGQPQTEQFPDIAQLGYSTVINLALPTSDEAIANEAELVTREGMNYIQIPVIWEKPELSQYDLFCTVMQAHQSEKIWVHCAKNIRVTYFVALYTQQYLSFSAEAATTLISEIWQPNQIWSEFMTHI